MTSIVGSGFGGGVLANNLAERGRRVLLIERGGTLFSTHLLNTSRPNYSRGKSNSPEGNETVYDIVKAKVQTSEDSEPYIGGPVYCLGGRSNLWGLWTPEAFPQTVNEHFPAAIAKYLHAPKGGYYNAFNLVTNNSQKDGKIYPLEPNGQITIQEKKKVVEKLERVLPGSKFDLMPVATELSSPAPYRFPQGAYSTTVALLNRMYAKDQFLTVLLHSEVLQVEIPGIELKNDKDAMEHAHEATAMIIRSATTGQLNTIKTGRAQVILSAGAIGTASIAINSGLQFHNHLVGKGLIDHDIWFLRFAIQRTGGEFRKPLNVKSRIKVGNQFALLTVTVNANFFLSGSSAALPIKEYYGHDGDLLDPVDGRKKMRKDGFDTIAILFEFAAELDDENGVLTLPAADPVIRVRRKRDHIEEGVQQGMEDIIKKVQSLYVGPDKLADSANRAPRPDLLGFGVFSHEVGTMRMDSPKYPNVNGVVDENLKVKGFQNLHVCDLSVFPVSTEANPALTLTALSLRLAEHLETKPVPTQCSVPTHNGSSSGS